ncbi:MAG: hypothetical protein KGN32_11525 [Burkholderiales bacterium]|nr:hypothetical protein [Burkholderiales bacterium]
MSETESTAYSVIQRALQEWANQAMAALQLVIPLLQVERLCAHGAAGLISKRRGQPSNRGIGKQLAGGALY